jgi:anti-sigma regulatory factor (Ser/Thr protein kinase)
LALAEGGGRRLLFTASDRDSDGSSGIPWCHIDAYERVPLNAAVRTGAPVHASLTALRMRFPEFAARQDDEIAAVAAIPVRAAGQTLGAFVLFFATQQDFDNPQIEGLRTLGEQLGVGLRAAQRADAEGSWELGDQPVAEGARVALHFVSPDLAEVSGARRFLEETLRLWGLHDEARQTAELCLSELATNALIHTHAGCQVRAVLEDGVLTVAVRDHGEGPGPARHEYPDPLAVHGRGLQVVECLAARWGSELSAGGTTVWFVLDL